MASPIFEMTKQSKPGLDRYGAKSIVVTCAFLLFQVGVLLIAAGKFDWTNAWLYTGLFIVLWAVTCLVMIKINPQLLNERGKFIRDNTKPFDKFFFAFWRLLNFFFVIIAGLDAGRYRWSQMSAAWVSLGVILSVLGSLMVLWAMAVNNHFESTVRIQENRNHEVCSSGPYKLMRHPGYLGLIAATLGAAFVLGSWWSLVPGGMIVFLVIIRTALEDRTLEEELPGYRAYTKLTHYRLIPLLW